MAGGRPWPKGVSGNPSGSAKKLPAALREKFKDNVDGIMQAFCDLALGKVPEGYTRDEIKTSDRIKAGAEVLDRVLGKAPQSIDATVTDVTETQRRMLEALAMTPHQRRMALAQDTTEDSDSDLDSDVDPPDAGHDAIVDE